mgnify:CR=1 FL=1
MDCSVFRTQKLGSHLPHPNSALIMRQDVKRFVAPISHRPKSRQKKTMTVEYYIKKINPCEVLRKYLYG